MNDGVAHGRPGPHPGVGELTPGGPTKVQGAAAWGCHVVLVAQWRSLAGSTGRRWLCCVLRRTDLSLGSALRDRRQPAEERCLPGARVRCPRARRWGRAGSCQEEPPRSQRARRRAEVRGRARPPGQPRAGQLPHSALTLRPQEPDLRHDPVLSERHPLLRAKPATARVSAGAPPQPCSGQALGRRPPEGQTARGALPSWRLPVPVPPARPEGQSEPVWAWARALPALDTFPTRPVSEVQGVYS